ncbi:MAG: type II secretion system F family protein [Phycisphaerales bacterium]|nr:MAG: type II secretion system F family protein [Phycisphaerales bacterium]
MSSGTSTVTRKPQISPRQGKRDAEPADHDVVAVSGVTRTPTADRPVSSGRRSEHRRVNLGQRLKTLSWFTRQLYVLVISGMPLVQAIAALERQGTDERWKGVLHDVGLNLEGGSSLAESLESHPQYFDSVFRSLVAAGESGGQLNVMLKRLSDLMAQQLGTRRAIVGAMVYPSLLIVIALSALVAMLVGVLPKFAGLFETLDVPLPPTTKWLLFISDVVRGYWWLIAVLAAFLIGLFIYALKTDSGRRLRDTLALKLPKIGPVVRDFATERIARLLGVLITSNVSVLEAMALVRQAMQNIHYVELMEAAEQAVSRGEPISSVLADAELINPSVYEAVRSGEQSGQVGSLLVDIADFLDEENRTAIRSLTSILEPVILILLGLIVGFVAISLFLPLFDLTAMT